MFNNTNKKISWEKCVFKFNMQRPCEAVESSCEMFLEANIHVPYCFSH